MASHRAGVEIRPAFPIAVVAAGAGARGAYEAGVLMPILNEIFKQRDKYKPTIFVGASAGAMNAVKLASLAHLDPCDAAEGLFAAWRRVHHRIVIRSALFRTLPMAAARYVARLLGLQIEFPSLLDTGPLLRTLHDPTLMNWQDLHRNVIEGVVDVVAVVTTEYGTNRTKVFFETANERLLADPKLSCTCDELRAVDYVPTTLTPEHVLASAAIPVVFPPVLLEDPNPSWNMDGGVRLNAPLRPAITFGANGIIVVATDPSRYRMPLLPPALGRRPTVQDAVHQVLHGAMSDMMIEDIRQLARLNEILETAGGPITKSIDASKSTLDWDNRIIPFIFGGPLVNNELGGVAAEALDACLHGVQLLKHLDLFAIRWLLGAGTDTRSDLMSYLLFEPEFIEAAIKRGQEDAEAIVQADRGLWKTSFAVAPLEGSPLAELRH